MPDIPRVNVEELLDRSAQGKTRPFICRCDDGQAYFVKGHYAGRRSLVAELLCAQLAQAFGLATAPFAVVDVPQAFMQPIIRPDVRDLGAGLAFGSMQLAHVQDVTFSQVTQGLRSGLIPARLARDVFMFDHWVCNADRTLTSEGGNPNLLWDYEAKSVAVIDHNLAFDAAYSLEEALQIHVFAAEGRAALHDLAEQAHYAERFERALATFAVACDNVPEEWWWVDEGVPAQFDRHAAQAMLARCLTPDFWKER